MSPAEVESVLKTHESVADAAVVGTDLDDGNELPTAFVVLKSGVRNDPQLLEKIVAFAARYLSPYKRLRGGIYAIREIPKNPMGKILYNKLRPIAQATTEGGRGETVIRSNG